MKDGDQCYEIKIWVLNTQTNKREKPSRHNTFWDDGKLEGLQSYLIIEYEISTGHYC